MKMTNPDFYYQRFFYIPYREIKANKAFSEQINKLVRAMNSFGVPAADIALRNKIIKTLSIDPIGCRSFHFYRTEGKMKCCMYCTNEIEILTNTEEDEMDYR